MKKICSVCHKAFYNSHENVKTCSKKCGSILRFKNKEKKLEQAFIKNLEQRHPDISYISGYKMQHRSDRRNLKILVKCKITDIRFYVYDSHLRKKKWKCSICNPSSTHLDIFPDDLWKYQLLNQHIQTITFFPCQYCGRAFEQHNKSCFCSEECRRKYKNLSKQRKKDDRTKQAKKNGNYDKSITLAKVYKRDRGVCYICGKHLILNDDYNRLDAPTIEHVVPICRGGTHTWGNVRLACRACNNAKGTKLLKEYIEKAS